MDDAFNEGATGLVIKTKVLDQGYPTCAFADEATTPFLPPRRIRFDQCVSHPIQRRARRYSDSAVISIGSTIFEDFSQPQDEAELYSKSSAFERAFPERALAVSLTLLIELPVVFLISNHANELCRLVGQEMTTVLLAFLPLTSAISGNVGLQSSSITTRAISHEHVTKRTCWSWLKKEALASCYLGLCMSAILGPLAFGWSHLMHVVHNDAQNKTGFQWVHLFMLGDGELQRALVFATAVAIAQFVSMMVAGMTGTFSPLMFSFIFKRDPGKWAGPLETAVQDIVGGYSMMILSQYIFKLAISWSIMERYQAHDKECLALDYWIL